MRTVIILSIIVSALFCTPVLAYDWSTNPGDGSPENPYQISTPEQLAAISAVTSNPVLLTKHYILMNDIVFTPETNPAHVFKEAVIAPKTTLPFSGSFDGNNHSISNLKFAPLTMIDDAGLFGTVRGTAQNKAVIKDLKVINTTSISDFIAGTFGAIAAHTEKSCIVNCISENTFAVFPGVGICGGLAGEFVDTEVVNCSALGYYLEKGPFATYNIGGLAGSSIRSTITKCSTKGKANCLTGLSNLGGLIGYVFGGTITDCHSEIDFNLGRESSIIGGLVGYNRSSTVSACSASGKVYLGHYARDLGGLAGINEEGIILDSGTDVDIDVNGSYIREAGGLVGLNFRGTLSRCHAKGNITCQPTSNQNTSNGTTGGLAGTSMWSTIEYCFATGDVNLGLGHSQLGGLVGLSAEGSISNSYALGNVNGEHHLGGLIGNCVTKTTRCYAAGNVMAPKPPYATGGLVGYASWLSVEQCYFLDRNEPYHDGLPLTDEQMTHKANFAGWDFIGESANGTEDIWGIHEGNTYPKLWWEFTNAKPIAEANDVTAYAWVDGFATVVLNGTGSRDEDGDALTYSWYNDANELIATGAEPNAVFGVGEYNVTLVVNDCIENSEPNFCKVTVIEAAQTAAKMLPQTIGLAGKKQAVKGRLAFTDKPGLDVTHPMLLLIGDLEIQCGSPVLEYSTMDAKWYLTGQFDCATMNSLAAGDTQVKLVTRLDSGQWLFGTDTVKIIKK